MAGSTQNDLANVPVPVEARVSRFPVSMSWWTLCSAMFYLYLAPVLAVSFGTVNAIIGIVLSVVSYAVISYVYTKRSIATGLSAELVSERIFGKRGAAFTALVVAATALYFGVFEGSILAAVISKVFPAVSYTVACVLVAALTVPFILSGKILTYFERANFVLLPTYLIGIVALFFMAGGQFGWSSQWLDLGPETPSPFGWWNCFVAYMGVWVLLVVTADFARFARREDTDFHALVTFGAPFYIVTFLMNGLIGIFLVGTVTVSQVSETAVMDASLLVMGGPIGLVFITATQLRINLANFYVATLNTGSFLAAIMRVRLPNWALLLLLCICAAILMATESVFQYLLVALQFMGIIICSWVGVTLFSKLPETQDGLPVAWRSGAMNSWFLATALGMAVSFIPNAASSFGAPVSFVVAAILCRLLPNAPDSRDSRIPVQVQ